MTRLIDRAARPYALMAGLLLASFLVLSFIASAGKSTTSDEPSHIASGLSYVSTGTFVANLQHPPLLKELSGLALLLGGVRWPNTNDTSQLIDHGAAGLEWTIGNSIIADGGAEHVMWWARLPFPLLATVLGVAIYAWGRTLVGERAALGAVFLYVLDPTIAAHAYLVATDIGFAAFEMLFLYGLWRYLERPDRRRAIWCGLAMGAMLASKFSAVALLPVAAILVAFSAIRPLESSGAAGASAVSAGPSATARRPRKKNSVPRADRAGDAQRAERVRRYAGGLLICALVAVGLVDAVYLFSGGLYFTGLGQVNADHVVGYQSFMAGDLAANFRTYFVLAYLLKEPLPIVVLAVLGFVLVWRRTTLTTLPRLFLLLPPIVLFAGYTMGADDLGVRYLIPIFPFAFLLGGLALATLFANRAVWVRATGVVLAAWLVITAVGIWPDGMSYFNELACADTPARIGIDGGSRCGARWLDDSNVDWGQGLIQLRGWLAQHANGRTVHVAAFGLFPPSAYGIQAQPLTPEDIASRPPSGLYVVTAHLVARLPAVGDQDRSGRWNWLRTEPAVVVGHAMYVYDIAADGKATSVR